MNEKVMKYNQKNSSVPNYFKILIPAILIAVVLDGFLSAAGIAIAYNKNAQDFRERAINLASIIQMREMKEDSEDKVKFTIQLANSLEVYANIFYEDGSAMYDNSEVIYCFREEPDNPDASDGASAVFTYAYLANPELISLMDDYNKDSYLQRTSYSYKSLEYRLILDSFILKDNKIYPEKASIYMCKSRVGADSAPVLTETLEYSPDVTGGMRYTYVPDDNIFGSSYPYVDENNKAYKFFCIHTYGLPLNESICSGKGYESYEESYTGNLSGETIRIFVAVKNITLTYFARTIILICVAASIVLIALAAFIAYRIYAGKKIAYEVNAQRKALSMAMAHDLKSPLTVIRGYAENLKEAENPEDKAFYSDKILNMADDMDLLINNILDFGKLEDGYEMQLKSINIKSIIEKILAAYPDNNFECSLENCNIKADEIYMTRALTNLIDNSVKYSSDGSTNLCLDEKHLTITNPYKGSLNKDEILKPFKRGDDSRSGSGNGLGLAIANAIMTLHNHKMTISTDNGIFTVNVLKLPT